MSVVQDGFKRSFFALVRAATSRLSYAAPRFAKVVAASDDGATLDVVPEDPAFPSMGGIPLFHGLPAVALKLARGTRVLVEFSEADPARPFVRSWAGGETLDSLSIAGGPAAARVGDSVTSTATPDIVTALAVSMVAAGLVLPGSPTGSPPAPVPNIGGEISSGSEVISLG